MLTGEIRNQVDRIWDAFWSGGISNPLEVIEQITYLLFLKRLDDLHTLEENKAARLKQPISRRIFPEGKDVRGRPYEDIRWSRFKNFAPAEMLAVISDHVFPFLRTLGGDDSTYAHHMKDARFTIPTPALLAKVVDLLDHVPMIVGPHNLQISPPFFFPPPDARRSPRDDLRPRTTACVTQTDNPDVHCPSSTSAVKGEGV
jgi:type I restriction enzyme M protein